MTTLSSEEQKHLDSDLLNVKETHTKRQSYVDTATSLNDSSDKVFSAESFYTYRGGKFNKSSIKVTPQTITIQSDNSTENIRLTDVLGATVKQTSLGLKKLKLSSEDREWAKELYILKIHLLVRLSQAKEEDKGDDEELSRLPKSRKYQKISVYGNDEKELCEWKNLILQAANNPNYHSLIEKHSFGDIPQFSRKFLVFVMSASGKGKANSIWKKCKKMLDRAGCESEEIFAEKIDTVEEYIDKSKTEDLQKFGAIMSVSGDGVPAYLVNKFYERPDWKKLADIPLMLIPGGSCCALTQNCVAKSHESPSLEDCCYILSKGNSFKADVIALEHEDGKKTWSFLEIMWASTSNIDLDSETFRFLGNVRFDIQGAWEILKLKRYKAKFSYSENADQPPSFNQELKGDEWNVIDDEFSYFGVHNMPWVGMAYEAIPHADHADGYSYFQTLKGENISRKNLLNTRKLLNPNAHRFKEDKDFEELGLTVGKFKSFRLEPYGEDRGKYSVDGEVCEPHKIQGWIMPNVQSYVGGLRGNE